MADCGEGFDGRIEVVRRTRGYRRWPEHVKAQIVAESLQPGVRVADVARRHGLAPHQLSDWRRRARQGELVLPAEAMAGLEDDDLPAFVPVSVTPDSAASTDTDRADGAVTIEIGGDVVLRVAGGVSAERAAAIVRALRGRT